MVDVVVAEYADHGILGVVVAETLVVDAVVADDLDVVESGDLDICHPVEIDVAAAAETGFDADNDHSLDHALVAADAL